MMMEQSLDKIVSLCKRRGFVFPGSDIYGGLANSWDWGPLGVELVNNVKNLWWKKFVSSREDMFGLSTDIIMNPKVWQASGHLKGFTDPLVDCKDCKKRFRADHLLEAGQKNCPLCEGELIDERQFNLMFKTSIGPVEDSANQVYLRPETAQGMFVNYKNVLDTMRPRLPFGLAQIGKAFRNEITPGNFIFRKLEFEQMEIEYFVEQSDWQKHFKDWQDGMASWLDLIGIDSGNYSIRQHDKAELSHYSNQTVDFEYNYPFGTKELYGLAYRTDYDLKAHGFKDAPHVIEPSFGVERTILAILCDALVEEDTRTVLKLDPKIAPYKLAVFPLLKNKPKLVKKARQVFTDLQKDFVTAWDDRGNIGKRYKAQDEIGTPLCVTVDFDTLKDDSVTIRDRDSMKQTRIKINQIKDEITRTL